MNWEALGAIGEIVGAVAVIVTLAYLAVQIRQNSRSLRAAAYQDAVRRANDWSSLLVGAPELYALFSRGISDYTSLSEEELGRFSHLLYMGMRNYQVADRLAGEGLISDEISEAYKATFGVVFKSPKMLNWLAKSEGYVSSDVLEKIRVQVAAAQADRADTLCTERHIAAQRCTQDGPTAPPRPLPIAISRGSMGGMTPAGSDTPSAPDLGRSALP